MGPSALSVPTRDTATKNQGEIVLIELRQLPRFPCQVENKKPLTPHGFKDAVRVRDDSGFPLVGVPTGVKFDVLDVDRTHPPSTARSGGVPAV
jgi:hypothetical protein